MAFLICVVFVSASSYNYLSKSYADTLYFDVESCDDNYLCVNSTTNIDNIQITTNTSFNEDISIYGHMGAVVYYE